MIIAVLLGLQIGAVPPSVVSVRAGTVESVVPLVETSAGRVLRLDRLAPALPVSVRADGPGRFVVSVFDVTMTLSDQVPYARVGASVLPLGGAPLMDRGALLVPLQLVAEVLPRLVPTRLSYDPTRSELRVSGSATTATTTPARVRTKRRVVVDAGHGGPDNGMTGPIGSRQKIREKDITLAVSHELAKSLRRQGVEVVMTRTTDTLIGLYEPGAIANERGG